MRGYSILEKIRKALWTSKMELLVLNEDRNCCPVPSNICIAVALALSVILCACPGWNPTKMANRANIAAVPVRPPRLARIDIAV